jgi:hypothetical protein
MELTMTLSGRDEAAVPASAEERTAMKMTQTTPQSADPSQAARSRARPAYRALPALVLCAAGLTGCAGGISKAVHCKFVSDVENAAAHYAEAASLADNPGWQAESNELKKTVENEQAQYCQ